MDKPTANRYRGDFVAWAGVCGFIGEGRGGVPISPHAHYAIQMVIGAPAGLRVQFGRDGEWQPCAAALVPSRSTHSIDVNDCDMSVVLFIEPETPEGRALSARLQGRPELLDADAIAVGARRIERAWRVAKSYDAVKAVCIQIVQEISRTGPRAPADPRVLAAVEYIRQRVDQPVSLPEVAQVANLSPGRFRIHPMRPPPRDGDPSERPRSPCCSSQSAIEVKGRECSTAAVFPVPLHGRVACVCA